jgi:hypothetical protein
LYFHPTSKAIQHPTRWLTKVPDLFTRLTDSEVSTLRSNLEKLVADPQCGRYLESLISNLSDSLLQKFTKFSGSIVENFVRIETSGGYWTSEMTSLGRYVRETIFFGEASFRPFDFQTDKIKLDEKWRRAGASNINFELSRSMQSTFTLVHELIHGYYPSIRNTRGTASSTSNTATSHIDMAIAAQQALISAGLVNEAVPITGDGSSYFGEALRLACGRVEL